MESIRRTYAYLIRAVYYGKIGERKGTTVCYMLNSMIKALKDILDMKMEVEKTNSVLVSDVKIEELRKLCDRFSQLKVEYQALTNGQQSGEVAQPIDNVKDTTQI